jgi:hypothetical protein
MKTKKIEITIKGSMEDKEEAILALVEKEEWLHEEIAVRLLENMNTGDFKKALLRLDRERLIKIAYSLHGALYKHIREV